MTDLNKFLNTFKKSVEKMPEVGTSSEPPAYWLPSGNYVQNYIMSGNFRNAIPQGRIVSFAGPSGAGKSYNVASACAAAIREGYIVLVVDSEDALDDGYMQGCGVDTESPLYNYTDVMTIPQCQKVVSTFISDYRAAFGNDLANAPKVLIAIDSLDMLMTETEHDNTRKGVSKGDQGQKNRQLKAMLRGFVHLMKDANISIITTSQVYKNQDLLNGEGVWVVGEAVKYAASTIIMVTKLKLRDASEVRGIRMKLEGYKTRFTKPFQTVTIELDYEKGIDEYSGLIDVAVGLGVLDKRGSRVGFVGDSQSFYAKDIGDHIDRLLSELDELTAKRGSDIYLEADLDGAEEMGADGESTKERRRNKVQAVMEAESSE